MSFLAGCPTGVIFAYGGTTAPDGWIVCDGTPISRSTYASLFTAIGVVHGTGDGSTTFHLPDYRGRILRGRDGGIARDPDRASRTAANTGGATGDAVGSVQAEATKKNGLTASASTSAVTGVTGSNASSTVSGTVGGSDGTHTHTGATYTAYNQPGAGSEVGYNDGNGANNPLAKAVTVPSTSSGHGHSFTGGSAAAQAWTQSGSGLAAAQTITIAAGDNETRPLNAYVNYIIKI